MFAAVRELGVRDYAMRETVPLVVAWLIAETWFKWGSFTLELVGFMATWLVLGFVGGVVVDRLVAPDGE